MAQRVRRRQDESDHNDGIEAFKLHGGKVGCECVILVRTAQK